MPVTAKTHTTARSLLTATLIASAAALTACDNLQSARGAKSIFQIVPNTTPEDAATLALDNYNADNRYRGITLLADADFGGAEVYVRLYEDATRDDDSGVRQAGIRALGLHGGPEHVPMIAGKLSDDDRLVRLEAARALQRLHNPVAARFLLQAINEEREADPDVRAAAAHALGQYRQYAVLEALINALSDPSLAVNTATLDSLETLTGQNFGLDRAAWTRWVRAADSPFLAGRVYAYPGFDRDRKLYEYLPFTGDPPNEPDGAPVGLPRDGG